MATKDFYTPTEINDGLAQIVQASTELLRDAAATYGDLADLRPVVVDELPSDYQALLIRAYTNGVVQATILARQGILDIQPVFQLGPLGLVDSDETGLFE